MASGTARHRFEFRLLEWAEATSRGWCGGRTATFVALREDGTVRRVYFEGPERPWDGEEKASLARTAARWFLYLPGDEPGRGYLEWSGLPAEVVRTWTGRAVTSADLDDVRGGPALDHWPEGWRVVLA